MKKIFNIFLFLLCLCMVAPTYVNAKKKKKEQDKTAAAASTKKDIYSKLFPKKEKHTVKKGLITIHKYESKIYIEMPLKFMKRDFLVSSKILSASEPSFAGINSSSGRAIMLDKTDSLVLFREPQYNVRIDESQENLKKAFSISKSSPIYKSFPIAGYSPDSTAILFNATSYFSANNKDILDLKGMSYGEIATISSCSVASAQSYIDGISTYPSSISVMQSSSVKLGVSIMGLSIKDTPVMTLGLQSSITLLPEEKMKPREANYRIGSGFVKYNDFRNIYNQKTGYYVTRQNIEQKKEIVFYVDTLIQKSWLAAVKKSAEGWNNTFEKQGLGRPIVLKPYAKDSSFQANDPIINTISFMNNSESSIGYNQTVDSRTGEILSTQITIPRDYVYYLRRSQLYTMAELDSRFRTYFLPDDLVCEALTANMLKAFGISLGLKTNLAGSYAYSPEELRSPEFTQKNGITASVMDDVLFNFIARPGDKEKGVVMVVDRPGCCDEFAIHYMYSPIQGNEEETLKKWAMEHDQDPRFFYGMVQKGYLSDPRCQRNDLGNDPIAMFDARIQRTKYVIKNATSWFNSDDVPSVYKELFPDFSFIEFYNKGIIPLCSYIGGIYVNDANAKSKEPSYMSVPKEIQRKVVLKILDACKDLSWFDSNKKFLQMGGANGCMSRWMYNSGVPMTNVMARLSRMGLSVEKSANPYTQEMFLNDVENYLFEEVNKGKALPEKKLIQVAGYINAIKNSAPSIKAVDKKAVSGRGIALVAPSILLTDDVNQDVEANEYSAMVPQGVNYYMGSDIEPICFNHLQSTKSKLMKARSKAHSDIERNKCDFIILQIDRAIKTK